jgi:hypothetical protein
VPRRITDTRVICSPADSDNCMNDTTLCDMKTRLRAASARWALASALTMGWLYGSPALAHHSFAPYNEAVLDKVTGTLKEFDWSAPHSGVTVVYMDKRGKPVQIFLISAPPNLLIKQGFRPDDFKPGMTVTVTWHPNRSGYPGGELVDITLPGGRVFHGAVAMPNAGGKAPPGPVAYPAAPQ